MVNTVMKLVYLAHISVRSPLNICLFIMDTKAMDQSIPDGVCVIEFESRNTTVLPLIIRPKDPNNGRLTHIRPKVVEHQTAELCNITIQFLGLT